MKRFFLLSALAILAANSLRAQEAGRDTLFYGQDTLFYDRDTLFYELQAIEVVASKASDKATPSTVTIGSAELKKNNVGYDIPTLLMFTPSLVTTTETGIGVGGSSMRIRGTDATRINVNVNGMPMNDPDSHAMYWYDSPDLAGSSGSIQVVRGAGTSAAGTSAFGGAVNISTESLGTAFGADAAVSYGSYNTGRQSVHVCSGLLGEHWVTDVRLSHVSSDGYTDRSASNMGSYMLQAGYFKGGSMLKFVSFGGKTKTYLSYDGVTPEDLETYGPTYHTSGQYKTSDGPFVLKDGTHVAYFDDQTDNYFQTNNQLIFDKSFSASWKMNAMLHYCFGNGWYRQYKDDAWLCSYNKLTSGWEQSDLIRRKKMTSHRAGASVNAVFNGDRLELVAGMSYMFYASPHYGTIDWIDGQDEGLYRDFVWYDNDVRKNDAAVFAKADWIPVEGLAVHGELQWRLVTYRAWGTNDNYDWSSDAMQPVNVDKLWNFLNPKLGISYSFQERHRVSVSFSVANKEPTRSDFTDRYNFSTLTYEPQPERLFDWELSYNYRGARVQAGLNLYSMDYRNQLVPTGIVNDSEDNLNINVGKSFRRGIEMELGVSPLEWLSFGANCTLSANKILDFDETLGEESVHHDKVDIAYSPSVLACAFLNFHTHGFEAVVRGQYVGKQYISNGGHDDLSLKPYFTGNIDLGYTLPVKLSGASIRLGIKISNFTNSSYCSYGYGGSYYDGEKRASWCYLFPQAPCNAMGSINITL